MRTFKRFPTRQGLVSLGLIGSLMLSGCMTVNIDEKTAFAPPKRDRPSATTQADLQASWQAHIEAGQKAGALRYEDGPDGSTKLIFLRPRRVGQPTPPSVLVSHGFTANSKVAWSLYTRAEVRDQETPRPLIVHCAGNAGDRYNSGIGYGLKGLPWGDVLVFDYPGYGDTAGPASAAAFEAASLGLSEHVAALAQNRPLVFWGHSLGGFVCSRLAASMETTDGLILETTAPNAKAVAKAWTLSYARLFVRPSVVPSLATYDVVAASARVNGPVLVLGAGKDKVLPVSLARDVASGLRTTQTKLTYHEFPDAAHETVPSQPGFSDTLSQFFQSVESSK